MDVLVRGYARLTPLAHLHLPSTSPGIFQRVHEVLLNEILLDPHLQAYPPAPEYQLKFWKWALQELEALIGDEVSAHHLYGVALRDWAVGQDTEIDARIYDRLVELVQSTPSSQSLTGTSLPPSLSYFTHYLGLSSGAPNAIRRITLLESRTTIEQGTTGLKTWPAAHALAEWLEKHPGRLQPFCSPISNLTMLYHLIERVAGKRILELGSGVGYLGLVAAAIQLDSPVEGDPEPSVWLTDLNSVVLSRCQDNLDLPCSTLRGFIMNFNAVTDLQTRHPCTNTYTSGSWIGSRQWTWMGYLPYVS